MGNDLFASLMSECNAIAGATPAPMTRFATCQSCLETYEVTGDPAKKCPLCQAECFQWVAPDKARSIEMAQRAAAKANPEPTPEPTPEPAVEAPKVEAVKKPRAKKAEVVVVVDESKDIEPPVVVETSAATEAVVDMRAERKAKIHAFIEKHKINEINPVAVGHGIVQTVGFTLWVNRKPVYRFQQPFESSRDFQAAYDEARAEQPALQIDCVQVCRLDNSELETLAFRGDLVASLNCGHGTQWARRGDVVELAAYKTKDSGLRFAVIKVKSGDSK